MITKENGKYIIKCDCGLPFCNDVLTVDASVVSGFPPMDGKLGIGIQGEEGLLTAILPASLGKKILDAIKAEFENQSG